MSDRIQIVREMYASFNARDIDGVLAVLADSVVWANGMDGGHVEGKEAVREYWTRQWAVVSPHVDPVDFKQAGDGAIVVRVRQTIRDLEGRPIEEAIHGLRDKTVGHVFHFEQDKVSRFDIADDL